MRLLLYHPATSNDGWAEPPLGLGYLSSVAKAMGVDCRIFDQDHTGKFADLQAVVAEFQPDVLGVGFMTPQYAAAVRAVRDIRRWRPGLTVIAGGPHPSALPERTLREAPEFDFIAKGEGERTLAEFIRFRRGELPLAEVAGLWHRRDDGAVVGNAPRPLMPRAELDDCAVDWEELLRHGPYVQRLNYVREPTPAFPVITARGCPFECTFCDEGSIWERKVRPRSVEKVIDEVGFLCRRYGARHFNILDDTFTLNPARVARFCRGVEALGINFRITAKVNTVTDEMLADLKRAGCVQIAYGVESGDQAVLDAIRKRQTVAQIEHAFALTRRHGIRSFALCMVGNQGETDASVDRTVALLDRIQPDYFSCSIMTPFPGSEAWAVASRNGWIRHHDWERWNPSMLRSRGSDPVARTASMDADALVRAYYRLNRKAMALRFRRKFGRLFWLHPGFYLVELWPRIRSIGAGAVLRHAARLLGSSAR